MTRAPGSYRKLTGVYRSVGAMMQLWLGEGHLLHVTSTGYTESYRRLYFPDIQSMVLVHTARRLYIHLVLVVLALLIGALIPQPGWVPWAVVAGIFLPFFIWNHLLGRGCRVVIVTAVGQENIRALSRLPKTRRVLAELEPLIREAQAGLPQPVAVEAGTEPPPLGDAAPESPPTLPPVPIA